MTDVYLGTTMASVDRLTSESAGTDTSNENSLITLVVAGVSQRRPWGNCFVVSVKTGGRYIHDPILDISVYITTSKDVSKNVHSITVH